MSFPNIFTKEISDGIINRINNLTPDSQRQWGKMDVAQMFAHCCVTYESIYEPGKHPKPNFLMGLVLKWFVKGVVTGDKPLKKNSPTAPQFIMKSDKDFAAEKARLIAFIEKTQQLGENEFDGKESHSFGVLNKTEWSNMMYKHLDHHLQQFGA
ncbi:MAG: DUF1569 domain-containing protein [Pyrinomonadaceae bacterium]|mgnify:CR=1 FL=1|nr:DUF1569 domain-containing protein [Pyrinomonadaceae bacterium]